MRDSASTKRLVVWSERIVHMNDRVMTPETHIRQDQGNEVLSFFRNRLVEDRPKAAKGAEGRAQPPSMDEVTVSVRAAKAMNDGPAGGISRMGSAAVAALSYIPDTDNLGDDDDEEEDVHFVEVSTVSGISLAGIQAGQASRRPPGRNPIKRGRTASAGIGSTARRGRDVERLEGSSVSSASGNSMEDLQSEIDKLSIYEILMNHKGNGTRTSIYNSVRHSAMIIHVCRPK